jgi:hypothetical protein
MNLRIVNQVIEEHDEDNDNYPVTWADRALAEAVVKLDARLDALEESAAPKPKRPRPSNEALDALLETLNENRGESFGWGLPMPQWSQVDVEKLRDIVREWLYHCNLV